MNYVSICLEKKNKQNCSCSFKLIYKNPSDYLSNRVNLTETHK